MIMTHKYEHFVQFTIVMLEEFVRKDINVVFRGLGRSTRFCNPDVVNCLYNQFQVQITAKVGVNALNSILF
jgi:hypothetical protein